MFGAGVFLLISSFFVTTPDKAVIPFWAVDACFAQVQEECIDKFGVVNRLSDVLKPKDAKAIRRLGCPRYECREDGIEELIARGDEAAGILYWGSRSQDQEIAARSNNALYRLFVCRNCKGTGQCPRCSSAEDVENFREEPQDQESDEVVISQTALCIECQHTKSCASCQGSGHYLFGTRQHWNPELRAYETIRPVRNFFAKQ